MIKRLSIFDTDAFIDILDDSFTRELKYMGKTYGASKREMNLTYVVMRLIQLVFGDVRDVPDILAYYEGGTVLGVTKLVPYNSRKDHWYSEITAVRKNLQKRGVGTALKKYTVTHYSTKARRLFGSVREDNKAMLKTNTRAGYNPYMKKLLLTKSPPKTYEKKEKEGIEGFRPFKNDEKGVYNLYVKRTPEDIVKIEDKAPEDFDYGMLMKIMSLWDTVKGEPSKKFVIEREGKICAYLSFEKISSQVENLEILLDPDSEDLSDSVKHILSVVSSDTHIISYIPEYRDVEKKALLRAGFTPEEVYVCMVVESGGE